MNWKRTILLLLALALCLCFFGCQAPEEPVSAPPAVSMKNDGHAASLTVGEVLVSGDRTAVLEEIAAKYRADFPETEIAIRSFVSQEELEAALRRGELDIAELSDREQVSYVQDGLLLDIRPYLDAWPEKKTLTQAALFIASSLGEDHAYLLPSSFDQQFLYHRLDWTEEFNRDKTKENEKVWHRTWDQVIRATVFLGDKSKLAFAGKEKLADCFDAILWSAVGPSRIADLGAAYYQDEEKGGGTLFTLERSKNAVDQFERLMKEAVCPGAENWSGEQALEAFQKGEAGMLLAGRSTAALLRETMPEGSWEALPFPQGLSNVSVAHLDSFTGWGISAQTEEQEIAAHFLTYLSGADNNTHYALACGTAPIHSVAGHLELSLNEGDLAAEMEMASEGSYYRYVGVPLQHKAYAGSREALDNDLRRFLQGELSRDELLNSLDQRWK